jgi:molybdopterin adenylyltransferase
MNTVAKMDTPIRIGVVTVSDRAHRGDYEDLSGPEMIAAVNDYLSCPWHPVVRVVPGDKSAIEEALKEMCDVEGCCLVLTSGGTGPSRGDVTPDATAAVCDRILDGLGERMRASSLANVPGAILSRQTAGIRGWTLIINLPGRPSYIRGCLDSVFPVVPYCIETLGGPRLEANEKVMSAYRPK